MDDDQIGIYYEFDEADYNAAHDLLCQHGIYADGPFVKIVSQQIAAMMYGNDFTLAQAFAAIAKDFAWAEANVGLVLCEECGRPIDAPHTADCEVALAQDFADGSIKPTDDSYGDAQAAFEAGKAG